MVVISQCVFFSHFEIDYWLLTTPKPCEIFKFWYVGFREKKKVLTFEYFFSLFFLFPLPILDQHQNRSSSFSCYFSEEPRKTCHISSWTFIFSINYCQCNLQPFFQYKKTFSVNILHIGCSAVKKLCSGIFVFVLMFVLKVFQFQARGVPILCSILFLNN